MSPRDLALGEVVKMNIGRFLLSIAILASSIAATAKNSDSFGNVVTNMNITEAEIEAAQRSWGQALLQISKDFRKSGLKAATRTADSALENAYGYNLGSVLFKPTLTSGDQVFRPTKEGALAYFVGGNKKFPNDSGFALKGWEKYEFKNAAVFISGNIALTMGNVMLTDTSGNVTKVDKTWGFKKDTKGQLRIVLHHSSLPFTP